MVEYAQIQEPEPGKVKKFQEFEELIPQHVKARYKPR